MSESKIVRRILRNAQRERLIAARKSKATVPFSGPLTLYQPAGVVLSYAVQGTNGPHAPAIIEAARQKRLRRQARPQGSSGKFEARS